MNKNYHYHYLPTTFSPSLNRFNLFLTIIFCCSVTHDQIYPLKGNEGSSNEVQDRLVRRLGAGAHPFAIQLPELAPASVQLQHESVRRLIAPICIIIYEA